MGSNQPVIGEISGELPEVLLLLEGTYPFIRGGVSKWVHDLILGMPERRFGLVFLGATRDMYGAPVYEVPPNVVFLVSHYLLDSFELTPSSRPPVDRECRVRIEAIHDAFREKSTAFMEEVFCHLVSCLTRSDKGVAAEDFFFGQASWEYICQNYEKYASDENFIAYFWAIRSMHTAVFKLARIVTGLPRAMLIHSVSTGYAGLLGGFLSIHADVPFILTEHGIYTKERKIDLQRLSLVSDGDYFAAPPEIGSNYGQSLWIRFFEGIGRLAYSRANPIISLYEGNRRRQIYDGAPTELTEVVPNGIVLDGFIPLRAKRPERVPQVLGLLGRLVPIKDVKTFIRAMRTVCTRCPEAEGWLIGPEEEDPEYVQQCRDLVRDLGLEERVKFLGFQDPKEILPKVGVLVLTSISEAFPLVILEAWASGLPVIATDVGACRDLIEGSATNGRDLGVAGGVVPIADPEATACLAIDLLTDQSRWSAAQRAGIQRVESYYKQEDVISRYREFYAAAVN